MVFDLACAMSNTARAVRRARSRVPKPMCQVPRSAHKIPKSADGIRQSPRTAQNESREDLLRLRLFVRHRAALAAAAILEGKAGTVLLGHFHPILADLPGDDGDVPEVDVNVI